MAVTRAGRPAPVREGDSSAGHHEFRRVGEAANLTFANKPVTGNRRGHMSRAIAVTPLLLWWFWRWRAPAWRSHAVRGRFLGCVFCRLVRRRLRPTVEECSLNTNLLGDWEGTGGRRRPA